MWMRVCVVALVCVLVSCQKTSKPSLKPVETPNTTSADKPKGQTDAAPAMGQKPATSAPARPPETAKSTTPGNQINVLDLGATGNGVTDDTEALEKALAAVQPGQSIYFPKGTYRISRPLLLKTAQVSVVGESEGKSTLLFDNSLDYHKKYGKRVGMLNLYADGLSVKGLTFDQNYRGSKRDRKSTALISCIQGGGAYLGKTRSLSRIEISYCRFYDFFGDAVGFFAAGANNLHVHHNSFVSSYIVQKWPDHHVEGEQCIGVNWAVDCIIEDNTIDGALDDAIAIHNKSSNVVIRRNTITTTAGRILLNGTNGGVIENNTIDVIEDADCAIFVSFGAAGANTTFNNGIVVKNNVIRVKSGVTCRFGIRLFGAGSNIEVNNNAISFASIPGVGIEIGDRKHKREQAFYAGSNVHITGNTITNARVGIQETIVRQAYSALVISKNVVVNGDIGVNARPESIQQGNTFKQVKQHTVFDKTRAKAVSSQQED
jgi:hypothetical protein